MKKEIRYDTTDVSNRDFAMPVEVTTTDATDPAQQATGEQQDGRRPLSKLDTRDLATLRAIVLAVIDDGCNLGSQQRAFAMGVVRD